MKKLISMVLGLALLFPIAMTVGCGEEKKPDAKKPEEKKPDAPKPDAPK